MNTKSIKTQQTHSSQSTNFLISIYHQENHSYQGKIQWLDTGKTISFRSELELLLLIQQATASAQKGSDDFRNWNEVQEIKVV